MVLPPGFYLSRILPADDKKVESQETGRGTTRAEDAQGTPTQSHISPSVLVYEELNRAFGPRALVLWCVGALVLWCFGALVKTPPGCCLSRILPVDKQTIYHQSQAGRSLFW